MNASDIGVVWGSPDGKLEWGFIGEEANKFRKSASFGLENGLLVSVGHEPDVQWVNTLVKDVSSVGVGLYSSPEKQRCGGDGEKLPQWGRESDRTPHMTMTALSSLKWRTLNSAKTLQD
ncbi:hypothetical protein L1987_10614 [Smallanthus sonchifolius]|uniref:Uncharacterized protein n=1 Tax=Smallanthus sonchifolius TaxID=185202 RepID=A0ACB9JSK0_9ASTR|nr:hypothetical protein L1987_10614 [Smallanthus sonchifolius]